MKYYILVGVVSAAVSSAVTYFLTRRKYEKKADEEIESSRMAYTDKINELHKILDDYGIDLGEEVDEEGNPMTPETPERKDREGYTDYRSYNKKGAVVERLDLYSHPEDSDEDEDEDEKESDRLHDLEVYERKKGGDKPRIIRAEEFETIPGWEPGGYAAYYTGNDALVWRDPDRNLEESDDVEYVEDEKAFFGDCLEKYDFKHSDERIIYVRNFRHHRDYEIEKVDGNFIDD